MTTAGYKLHCFTHRSESMSPFYCLMELITATLCTLPDKMSQTKLRLFLLAFFAAFWHDVTQDVVLNAHVIDCLEIAACNLKQWEKTGYLNILVVLVSV